MLFCVNVSRHSVRVHCQKHREPTVSPPPDGCDWLAEQRWLQSTRSYFQMCSIWKDKLQITFYSQFIFIVQIFQLNIEPFPAPTFATNRCLITYYKMQTYQYVKSPSLKACRFIIGLLKKVFEAWMVLPGFIQKPFCFEPFQQEKVISPQGLFPKKVSSLQQVIQEHLAGLW